MKLAMYLILIQGVLAIPYANALKASLRRFMGFCTFKYVSNEHRVQGLPVRFVRSTIIKGN